MAYQMSLADALNQAKEPIGIGDYIEHVSRPGIAFLVVCEQYKSLTGNICIDVRDSRGKTIPVMLENVRRV